MNKKVLIEKGSIKITQLLVYILLWAITGMTGWCVSKAINWTFSPLWYALIWVVLFVLFGCGCLWYFVLKEERLILGDCSLVGEEKKIARELAYQILKKEKDIGKDRAWEIVKGKIAEVEQGGKVTKKGANTIRIEVWIQYNHIKKGK